MSTDIIEHIATLWMADDVPARMVYDGKRWRVTDTPTRIRREFWASPTTTDTSLSGWRFQGTDESGHSLVFDLFKDGEGWHVDRTYSL